MITIDCKALLEGKLREETAKVDPKPLDSYNPSCYVVGSDCSPYASDPQHIFLRLCARTVLRPATHPAACH